jgi:hypothetical protein
MPMAVWCTDEACTPLERQHYVDYAQDIVGESR